ncbi:MAG: hypothetical protein EOP46_14000 [Sphingobacteriaceae bacterium]|nr:MAG: hypothetical protein EOP46_14000 [Sphingobacteriaceae bacterium]
MADIDMPLHRLSGKKLFLFFIVCLALPIASCAQQELKNLPEYSLPLTDKKLVIAHNMTGIIRFKGHELEDSANPKYYKPTGNISETLGGLTQVNVITDSLLSNATLDEAVEFEMRAALRSGIDGFQFYYILGLKSWDDIIKAYFRVAGKKSIPFKFTFCVSHPDGRTEADKIEEFAQRINGIMDEVGHDNPHWLRTPDGRLIVYMWNGEGLADIPKDKKELPDAYYIARAYKRLADRVNERFACVFSINEQIDKGKLNDFLNYFPATWIWTLAYNKDYIGPMVADACLARGRTFTGSVFGDFYTSKLLRKGTWNMYHRVDEAVADGIKKVERRYVVTGLSYNFRKLLEFGISRDVPIINVITWNDYPEGHHLAPEVNHNYGFSVLLNHYKSVWKQESIAPKDIAIVFFKKYQHKVKPNPYNIPVVQFEPGAVPERFEDSIDVVTILPSSAMLKVNGEEKPVAAGLQSTKFPSKPGAVELSVSRDGKQTVHFITPEWITDKPYRTDRLTYVYSSKDAEYHKDIFGDMPPIQSTEYNKQAKQ